MKKFIKNIKIKLNNIIKYNKIFNKYNLYYLIYFLMKIINKNNCLIFINYILNNKYFN